MKQVIYKYKLNYTTVPEIVRLPKGARIVDFGVQNSSEDIVLWALVKPIPDRIDKTGKVIHGELEERVFMLAFTGQEIKGKILEMFGTKIVEKTGIVIHLLELDPTSVKPFDPKNDERLK